MSGNQVVKEMVVVSDAESNANQASEFIRVRLNGLPGSNPGTIVGFETLPEALSMMNGMIHNIAIGSSITLYSYVDLESGGVIDSDDTLMSALSRLQNQITALTARVEALEALV